jgi:hypothetical protein
VQALKRDLGHLPADRLTALHFSEHFMERHHKGAGVVVLSSQLGYLS